MTAECFMAWEVLDNKAKIVETIDRLISMSIAVTIRFKEEK